MKTTISKDGTTLAYDVYGQGPALIFITGAACFRTFNLVMKDVKVLAKEFTVYNYDRRGRGDSGNTLPYSPEREVEDIEAMIDAAGGTACLYGHSSGAVLALESAMRLGNKVSKVVTYDPSYVHDETEKAEYKRLSQGVHELLDAGQNGKAMSSFLKGIGIPKVFILLMRLSPDWKRMVALAPTLAYDITLTSDVPPISRASHITAPTKIIVGEKSPAAIHDVGSQLSKAIPGAQYVQLVGQDHMPSPAVVLPELVSFLK